MFVGLSVSTFLCIKLIRINICMHVCVYVCTQVDIDVHVYKEV